MAFPLPALLQICDREVKTNRFHIIAVLIVYFYIGNMDIEKNSQNSLT